MTRMLLIEDNVLTRKVVRRAFANEGWELVEAGDAKAALAALEDMRPDLVLLDLILPDGSGSDLARRLRTHPSTKGVPILAFTGLLTQGDGVDAALFDGLLAKPIEPSYLVQQVRAHLPMGGGERRAVGRGRRLIVADDDVSQLKLARFRLAKLGFDVEAVADGQQALEAARRQRPDIIVTDALMPRLDGFALCKAVRDDPALRAVPVVLVTSSYLEAADRELAARTGASAFVVRTADLADVVAAVEGVITGKTSPAVAPESPESWESARLARTTLQLERQVAHNAALGQQCSTLAAELSVLSTVADALVDARDIESAMADVLSNCVDVAGTSRGAICLRDRSGALSLPVHHGLPEAAVGALLGILRAVGAFDGEASVVPLFSLTTAESLAAASLGEGAVVARLSSRGDLLGHLVLDVPGKPPDGWISFVGAVANQVSFALALARAFDRLTASEERSRTLMEHAADAIFALDSSGRLVDSNRASERLTGTSRSRIVGRHLREILMAEDGNNQGLELADVEGERGAALPCLLRRADGGVIPVEATSAVVDVATERVLLLVVRDVSERNALAEQLRQSQKMEAMGRLAGGVAHDFNNLLSIILGYCEFAHQAIPPGSSAHGDIAEVEKAGQTAAHLTKQLLLFSRQQPHQPRWVSVNATLQNMEKMLGRILGEDVALSVEVDPTVGLVWIDPGSVEQVIMNLVVNARDAMPRGGTLRLTTASRAAPDDRTEGSVVLAVADSGTGIDAAVRARIFEPFFTTKASGKGTGLGLSTVFGIVQRAGGHVEVESQLGRGTTFTVVLPRGDGVVPSSLSRRGPNPGGTETVLVVEDEPSVRAVAAGILRRLGYRVIEAADPAAALDLWLSAGDPIHVVLTDMVMPGMSGVQLTQQLRITRPDARVVCMSGYTAESIDRDGVADVGIIFIQKPITPTSLAEAVRAALDGTPLPDSSRTG